MKTIALMFAVLVVLCGGSSALAVVKDDLPATAPITFSDGSVAAAFDHCGDADLCATIDYPNGDKLSIYSEGAAYCQPYLLHFVKVHGTATIYEFSRTLNHDAVTSTAFGVRCGNNQATQMTLDHGLVHLTVDEYSDGSLRFRFSIATPPKK
ncbi:MAG: hypothetical protein GIW95_07685 [Candidatus Eremiobacteraeota bacterium]|nr:hypothetical protein [Candidatus Eremiobacteraeota bacterium]